MKIKLLCLTLMISWLSYSQYSFDQIDIWSGSNGSSPRYFTEFNGEMYFQAFDITPSFKKLYKTNGTASGTQVVATNLNGGAGYSPESMYVMNGELFFTATVSGLGIELYKTDGTDAGTVLIKDIRTGSSNGMDSATNDREVFVEYNGELYFRGSTDSSIELWKTDGTEAGTVSVKNFEDTEIGAPSYISRGRRQILGVEYNGLLYFYVNRNGAGELWRTDGTTANTEIVRDDLNNIDEMIVFDNQLFFVAEDATVGRELWVSDGTSTGTVVKHDLFPNDTQSSGFNVISSNPGDLIVHNNELYFTAIGYANNESTGKELWKSDGNTANLIKDIKTGNGEDGINLPDLTIYNNELYFTASDDTTSDFELWKTDGTEAGTLKVVGVADTGESIELLNAITYGGNLFYIDSQQLWVTDGTPQGTEALTGTTEEIIQVSTFAPLVFQSKLWFSGTDVDNGNELTSLTDANVLSIEDFEKHHLQIYPNPVSDFLFVSYNESMDISSAILYNSLGQKMMTLTLADLKSGVEVYQLNHGIYLLSLRTKSGQHYVRKIIKN